MTYFSPQNREAGGMNVREAIRLILIGAGLRPEEIQLQGFTAREVLLGVSPERLQRSLIVLQDVGYHVSVSSRGMMVTK